MHSELFANLVYEWKHDCEAGRSRSKQAQAGQSCQRKGELEAGMDANFAQFHGGQRNSNPGLLSIAMRR